MSDEQWMGGLWMRIGGFEGKELFLRSGSNFWGLFCLGICEKSWVSEWYQGIVTLFCWMVQYTYTAKFFFQSVYMGRLIKRPISESDWACPERVFLLSDMSRLSQFADIDRVNNRYESKKVENPYMGRWNNWRARCRLVYRPEYGKFFHCVCV